MTIYIQVNDGVAEVMGDLPEGISVEIVDFDVFQENFREAAIEILGKGRGEFVVDELDYSRRCEYAIRSGAMQGESLLEYMHNWINSEDGAQ